MDAKLQLIQLLLEKSYREGDFVLSSGQKSSYYIDVKPTALLPQGAFAIARLMLTWIQEQKLQVDAVAGLTLGADPLVMAVSMCAYQDLHQNIPAVIVRKEPKKHGTSRFLGGVENLNPGARVLDLEDVVTTGGSALKAIQALTDAGFKPVAVAAVVDRLQGAAGIFHDLHLRFHALVNVKELSEQYRLSML